MSFINGGADALLDAKDKEIADLKEKLEQAEQNVKDFERLAHVWKKAYEKDNPRLIAHITELEQIVEDLEDDLSYERRSN